MKLGTPDVEQNEVPYKVKIHSFPGIGQHSHVAEGTKPAGQPLGQSDAATLTWKAKVYGQDPGNLEIITTP